MREADYLVFAGIAPHPPIMVPEIGRDAAREVRGSIEAMEELTKRVRECDVESLILISPHAPLEPDAFVAYEGPQLYGDFANFRSRETVVEAPLDDELMDQISALAGVVGFTVIPLERCKLDHGTAVPLYFLQRNGWSGQVVALGYSFLSSSDHQRFGECLRKAANSCRRRVGLIASGDLSHRLKPDAPAGYDPSAHLFDQQVVEALESNQPNRIAEIDPELRKLAGECGYRSMLIAIGATSTLTPQCEVLNYEAPFGVGYMVAQLIRAGGKQSNGQAFASESDESEDVDGAILPKLARLVVETYTLTGETPEPQLLNALLKARAACFVSLKTMDGELRGCIGTIEPVEDTLAAELVNNAIGAAIRDPRFPPVRAAELRNLRYSVDVLSPAEPAAIEDLDPVVYGVIVEEKDGPRRGLLLPDIEGIETASQQVEIAARKAGIPHGRPLLISRFRVNRFREELR